MNKNFEKKMRVWFDSPAPDDDKRGWRYDSARGMGWEAKAFPLGNGYFGARVFGLTERERIQLSENSISTSGTTRNSGNTSFGECYIHFNHSFEGVTDYKRELSLDNSVATVEYSYEGVKYSREYFSSYPDKVTVIKLTSSKEKSISFDIETKIPYFKFEGRSGDVTAEVDNDARVGTLKLTGHLPGSNKTMTDAGYEEGVGTVGYEMDFESLVRVFVKGGEISSSYTEGGEYDSELDEYSNAKISVLAADEAYILIALGTNYELCPKVFMEKDNSKKLSGLPHPHERILEYIEAASKKGYEELKAAHINDYGELFSRAKINLCENMPEDTTDVLLKKYKEGSKELYLEELIFQFGRYMLISSSRANCLPPNLNGIWNRYHTAICLNGYWSNVNVQMNFWSAFNTNLAECFESYLGYYKAYHPANSELAKEMLVELGRCKSKEDIKGELWSIETGLTPFYAGSSVGGRDGWGNAPYMAESFFDLYDYTRDIEILKEKVLPALICSADFLTRLMVYDEKTGLYLTENSGSPEQSTTEPYIEYLKSHPDFKPRGSSYDIGLAYSNYKNVLTCVDAVGEDSLSEYQKEVVLRIREQIEKLEPVPIGFSGQVKEFREEGFYGEIGEPEHRHISHLATLHPASVINESESPVWLDAARVTMQNRGTHTSVWARVLRIIGFARLLDGERAYGFLSSTVKEVIADNLSSMFWGMFQIEGNLGLPSAITEMLLQSHAGYIEPLAAIPSEWKSGSYSGLVARGAFEISCEWESGKAKKITVLSKKGGECRIKIPGLIKASVSDCSGNAVSLTVSENIIFFETHKGESYEILPEILLDKIEAPEKMSVKRGLFNTRIDFSEVKGAEYYNLYVAENSNPKYKLVKSGIKNNAYIMKNKGTSRKNLYTYAVSAVSKNGTESRRKTVTVAHLSLKEIKKIKI